METGSINVRHLLELEYVLENLENAVWMYALYSQLLDPDHDANKEKLDLAVEYINMISSTLVLLGTMYNIEPIELKLWVHSRN